MTHLPPTGALDTQFIPVFPADHGYVVAALLTILRSQLSFRRHPVADAVHLGVLHPVLGGFVPLDHSFAHG